MQAQHQAKNDLNAARTETKRTVRQQFRIVNEGLSYAAQREAVAMLSESPRMLRQRSLSDYIHDNPRTTAQRSEINTLIGTTTGRRQLDGAVPAELSPPQHEEKTGINGLPARLKSGIESLSGMPMNHVKVHYNSDKPALLQAHAYARGSEIHLGAGQERHLPHEAWHIVQQAQGRVRPTLQTAAGEVNDDPSLETEADMMGERAARFEGVYDPDNLSAEERKAGLVTQRAAPVAWDMSRLQCPSQPAQLTRTGALLGGAAIGAMGLSMGPVGAMVGGIAGALAGAALTGFSRVTPRWGSPGGRSGNAYGVGEILDLTYTNPLFTASNLGDLAWRERGGLGTFTHAMPAAGSATYTADVLGKMTLELYSVNGLAGGRAGTVIDTHAISIIAPNDATMTNGGPNFNDPGLAGSGFWGIPSLRPRHVSFQGIEWSEGSGVMVANGAYSVEHGRVHVQGAAHGIDVNNDMIPDPGQPGGDDIRSMGIPQRHVVASDSSWPINWQYRLAGLGGAWNVFTVATHANRMDQDGNVRASKKGASEYRARPWPRTTWDQTFRRFNPLGGP